MKLGELLKAYRTTNAIPVRTLAKQIGIEPTALFRFERGHQVSKEKWVAILLWILN